MFRLSLRRSLLTIAAAGLCGTFIGSLPSEADAQYGYRYGSGRTYYPGAFHYPRRGFSLSIGSYGPYGSSWGLSYRGLSDPYGYGGLYGHDAAPYGYGGYLYGSPYTSPYASPYASRYGGGYGRYSSAWGGSSFGLSLHSGASGYRGSSPYLGSGVYADPRDGIVPTESYRPSDSWNESLGESVLEEGSPLDPSAPAVPDVGLGSAWSGSIGEPTSDLRPGMVLPDGSTVISVGPLLPATPEELPASDDREREEL